MYYLQNIEHPLLGAVTLILRKVENGNESFIDVDSNSGPERVAFLEWVAAGGVPEPWNGE